MEMSNSDSVIQRSALIFSVDDILIRLVSYSIKQRSEGDGSIDFYDYLSDLRSWLKPAFLKRDFADFHVNNTSSNELLRSENPNTWGNYCLYYITSFKLSVNQACKDVIRSDLSTERFFFRENVFLIKHKDRLSMSHEYINTSQTMTDITVKVIKKMYENESLEKKLESDRNFQRESEKHSELPSNNCLISFKPSRTSASGNVFGLRDGCNREVKNRSNNGRRFTSNCCIGKVQGCVSWW